MKQKRFKHILAMVLALAMVFCMVACSSDDDSEGSSKGSGNKGNGNTGNTNEGGSTSGVKMEQATELSDPDLRYVMIYNPKVYDERSYSNSTLTVGSFGSQVDAGGGRGDGVQTEPEFTSISQLEWTKYLADNIQLEENRGDVMGVDYDEGDTQLFYYSSNGELGNRNQAEFTCQYAGEYCYIWTMDTISQSVIEDLGEEFDENIYEEVSSLFGTPRFVGETGKINILLYDMTGGLMGYFALPDLFVKAEHKAAGLEGMTCNTGHAIINVNAQYLGRNSGAGLYSTMAHELQHLINFSAYFDTTQGVWMNTWCNEAMSGYIEEKLYPGAIEEEGRFYSYNSSDLIRNGQSLYNFETSYFDIGVYGSVYYFSRYMEKLAGKNVFSDMMDYWRTSYSDTLSTAEALSQSVSKEVYREISNTIDYSPLKLRFASEDEEWMSKLCLDFYLNTLSDSRNVSDFDEIDQDALLYDSIDGAEIEGGGRVIVALSDDTFEIPEDSDEGLIYIGLDKNFEPITGFVYQ